MVDTDPCVVLKSLEMTIKSVGKDIRDSKGGADRVNRMAALANSYTRLVTLVMEDQNKPFDAYAAQMKR